MFELLLFLTIVSALALLLGNNLGIFFGMVGLAVSIIGWLFYVLFAGLGALIGGFFLLVTNINLGGGIIVVGLIVGIIFLVIKKRR